MNVLTPMKVLLPSFIGYWVFMVALASGAWYLWTKLYAYFQFKWQAPVLVATTATIYLMASTMIGFYQNNVMLAFEKGQGGGAQTVAADPNSLIETSPQEMKAAFLKEIEGMIANPEQITTESKTKLFSSYAALFVTDAEKSIYAYAIGDVYNCQKAFWQDALAAYKSKKEVKSALREECEAKSGAFFNRAKLVPDESATQNNETIANLAGHKRVPASDGKMVEVDEPMIRKALDAQIKASDSVKKIFE